MAYELERMQRRNKFASLPDRPKQLGSILPPRNAGEKRKGKNEDLSSCYRARGGSRSIYAPKAT